MKNSTRHLAACAALASLGLLLSACGDGADPATTDSAATPATPSTPSTPGTSATGASGSLTISAASPASQNGTIDFGASNVLALNTALTTVSPAGIEYCDITYAATSSSGSRYEIKVYFRRSDQKVLNASFFKTDFSWGIGESDLAAGITAGVAVNLGARSITFSNKVLKGFSGTDVGTVNGTITFPANTTVAACGA